MGAKYLLGYYQETLSGHYIAYVQKEDNWYSCDESRVQRIESLPEQCGDTYLLFFIKQFSIQLIWSFEL